MNVIWQIIKRDDDTFDVLRDGTVLHERVPDRWLKEQLGRYGFCGQEYTDIRRMLEESGEARYEFTYPCDRPHRGHRSLNPKAPDLRDSD